MLFILFNLLFHLSSDYKVSLLFRVFSFWFYLLGLIVLNDSERLAYLSFLQFENISHFDTSTVLLQGLSVGLIGLWFVLCISLYLIYSYLYRSKLSYFLANMHLMGYSIVGIVIRFSIKPILQGAVHCLLRNQPDVQLSLLVVIELTVFLCLGWLNIRHGIVKAKASFVFDCLVDLVGALITMLLYAKHVYIGKSEPFVDTFTNEIDAEAFQSLEESIIVCINVSAFVLGSIVLWALL